MIMSFTVTEEQCCNMLDLNELKNSVKAHLKPSRYHHTMGVLKFAVKLAEVHNVDIYSAEVAALLHDYGKHVSDQDILSSMDDEEKNSVILNCPNLGHGTYSAVLAEKKFKVTDHNILNAIRNHTFGRKGMSKLEKIIYLADSLEEGRSYEGIEKIRALALVSLDEALLLSCSSTLLFELKRGNMIHEKTIELRNALLEEN